MVGSLLALALALALVVGTSGYNGSTARASSGPGGTTATRITGTSQPGPWVTQPNCVQPPAQSVKDHATFTLAEQQLYGMPTRAKGEPFAHWANIVRSLGTRICQYRDRPGLVVGKLSPQSPQRPLDINNAGNAALPTWAGNIADEPVGGTPYHEVTQSDPNSTYWYTETDADWNVPCIVGSTNGSMLDWIGLGGSNPNGQDQLSQAGSESYRDGFGNHYFAFYEGVGPQGSVNAQEINFNSFECGNHLYVQVNNTNCYMVSDLTHSGEYFHYCHGPAYSNHTAEAIVEGFSGSLVNFGYVTFKGVGITENTLGYQGFPNLWHGYSHMTDNHGTEMAHTDPIVSDPNDYPPNDFDIDWNNAGCGC